MINASTLPNDILQEIAWIDRTRDHLRALSLGNDGILASEAQGALASQRRRVAMSMVSRQWNEAMRSTLHRELVITGGKQIRSLDGMVEVGLMDTHDVFSIVLLCLSSEEYGNVASTPSLHRIVIACDQLRAITLATGEKSRYEYFTLPAHRPAFGMPASVRLVTVDQAILRPEHSVGERFEQLNLLYIEKPTLRSLPPNLGKLVRLELNVSQEGADESLSLASLLERTPVLRHLAIFGLANDDFVALLKSADASQGSTVRTLHLGFSRNEVDLSLISRLSPVSSIVSLTIEGTKGRLKAVHEAAEMLDAKVLPHLRRLCLLNWKQPISNDTGVHPKIRLEMACDLRGIIKDFPPDWLG